MASKHFSHSHSLVIHHLPQGSETHCSGCKSPVSGDVYACWQCSYFLHDQCFHASRSVKHPSHPLHPLTFMPFPTYPSSSFFCDLCSLGGDGFCYGCSECDFDIHVHCALIPTPNPHLPLSPGPALILNSQPQNPIYPPANIAATTAPPPPPPPIVSQPIPIEVKIPQSKVFSSIKHFSHPHLPPSPGPALNLNSQPQNPIYPQANAAATTAPPPIASQPSPIQMKNPQSKVLSSIKHFSHPHTLKPFEFEQDDPNLCSACDCELSGSGYNCTESDCGFILHKACFDLQPEILHKSHPEHPLTLLSAPAYGDEFTCDACQKEGKAFVYSCAPCSYDLHTDCVRWSETVTRPDHEHPLTLHYSSPYGEEHVSFMCDVCRDTVDERAWVYYCRECDFGTHLECVQSEIAEEGEESGNVAVQLMKLQQQQQTLLDFQMQMSRQNAEFVTSMANSWKSFY